MNPSYTFLRLDFLRIPLKSRSFSPKVRWWCQIHSTSAQSHKTFMLFRWESGISTLQLPATCLKVMADFIIIRTSASFRSNLFRQLESSDRDVELLLLTKTSAVRPCSGSRTQQLLVDRLRVCQTELMISKSCKNHLETPPSYSPNHLSIPALWEPWCCLHGHSGASC